jgi:ribosomal protein L29
MAYSIPRDAFLLLEEAFNNDRQKAEIFAKAIEGSIQAIEHHSEEQITHKKEALKSELYNELRTELATKEFVRAEIATVRAEIAAVRTELSSEIANVRTELSAEIAAVRTEISVVRSELKQNTLWLKILVGIAVFGLTLFNPAFVKLVELVMAK